MWICELCKVKEISLKLNDQVEFVLHLKSCHLQKFYLHKETVFRCSYGENGECKANMVNGSYFSEFTTEKEYESHLVKFHLKQDKFRLDNNPFNVRDPEVIENSCNYQRVCNQTMKASKWTVHNSLINLPAVLNDPFKRQLDIFCQTWGESFEKAEPPQCSHLVEPPRSIFTDYINQLRKSEKYREKMLRKIQNEKISGPNSEESNPKQNLNIVPKIFFQIDFNLNSKDIFSSVIPIFHYSFSPTAQSNFFVDNTHSITKKSSGPKWRSKDHKWLSDNAASRMNEKLSYYLDIIELHIAKQVSKKSTSFFEAISTQDKVREKIYNALFTISGVRSKLQLIDQNLTKNHMKVLLLVQRKRNLQRLHKKLEIIKTIHSAQSTIQTFLSTNDFCGALDLIAGTLAIMGTDLFNQNDKDNTCSIICLKHVKAQLAEMLIFVSKMVKEEFVNSLSSQLRIEDNWQMNNTDKMEIDYQMVPSLMAIIRQSFYTDTHDSLHNAVKSYEAEALSVCDVIVKTRYHQTKSRYYDISSTAASDKAGEQVEKIIVCLDFDQWFPFIQNICKDNLQLLDKVKNGCYTITEIITESNNYNPTYIGACDIFIPETNRNTIFQLQTTIQELKILPIRIADEINDILLRQIKNKKTNNFFEKLSPEQFVKLDNYFKQVNEQMSMILDRTVESCCKITSIMKNYATRLVNRFHAERQEKLISILETDVWKATEVPSQIQDIARHISNQSVLSLPERNGIHSHSISEKTENWLQLDQSRFIVVSSALILFKTIVEYCQYAKDFHNLPNISEILFNHLMSLLEKFHSRSYELVLRAQARKYVELGTITAHNLGVACRSLQMVIALLPRISTHFSNLFQLDVIITSKVSDIKHKYQQHIDEINSKLLDLMRDKIRDNLSNWNAKPPSPSFEFRSICRNLLKLHDSICGIYSSNSERELFLKIHNLFKAQVRVRMKDINIINDNGPQHGLVKSELAYYMSQLNIICCLRKYSDNFSDIW